MLRNDRHVIRIRRHEHATALRCWEVVEEKIEQGGGQHRPLRDTVWELSGARLQPVVRSDCLSTRNKIGQPLLIHRREVSA